MFKWLADFALTHAHPPERLADIAMRDVRLELFRAEQKVLEAQLLASYYREQLKFLERVKTDGIENAVDQRSSGQTLPPEVKVHPKFAAQR